MTTVQDIKAAIDLLSTAERAELESMLREQAATMTPKLTLPDQAERRRLIFGDKVLPNYVLLAREGKV